MKQLLSIYMVMMMGIFGNQALAQTATIKEAVKTPVASKLSNEQIKYLNDKLTLTAEQTSQLVPILNKYNERTNELYNTNMLTTVRINSLRENSSKRDLLFEKVFTADQNKQYQAIKQEFNSKFPQVHSAQ